MAISILDVTTAPVNFVSVLTPNKKVAFRHFYLLPGYGFHAGARLKIPEMLLTTQQKV